MKINRCPKCGREPLEVKYSTISRRVIGYKMLCDICFTTSGIWETRRKAIEKWNELMKGENNAD